MLRALVAGTLLVASLGTVGALAWWAHASDVGKTSEHLVLVVAPEGEIFNGTLLGTTALGLLEATGLPIEVERYPGMGAYVGGIAGHRAGGGAGWVYETSMDGHTWTSGDRSPSERLMQSGERLAWRWTQG